MTTTRKLTAILFAFALVAGLAACGGGESDTAAPVEVDEDAGYTVLDPAQLDSMMKTEDVFLVNVHVPYEGELPDTDAFIPYTEIVDRMDELPFEGN